MNKDTLVVVCGYAGDAHQVQQNMPLYVHHGCPVLVLSPVDSPIPPVTSGITYLNGGKRAYIGQESLDRQRIHLSMMRDFPQQFFLANDSDSFCLSPKLPDYLYQRPDVLWSNLVIDTVHTHQRPKDYTFPQVALQPPYFFSRKVLDRMLEVAGSIVMDPLTPFIDHYMLQLAVAGGIPYLGFPDGMSCESTITRPAEGKLGTPHPFGCRAMENQVRNHGKIFMHSIKLIDVVHMVVGLRDEYVRFGPKKKQ